MADKNNVVCKICGKPYYACMSCADSMKLKPWQTYCCSSNCYKVFQVVRGFSTGVYTKDEAREKFKNIDLGDVDSFRPHIRDIIKDVLKEETVVVEEVATNEVVTDDVMVDEVVTKSTVSRKRNYKVETE